VFHPLDLTPASAFFPIILPGAAALTSPMRPPLLPQPEQLASARARFQDRQLLGMPVVFPFFHVFPPLPLSDPSGEKFRP